MDELFSVTIANLVAKESGEYTVTIDLLTTVYKNGEIPASISHSYTHQVSAEEWIINKDDNNIYYTSSNPWSYKNNVWANISVRNPGVEEYTSTFSNTLVKRNQSSAYGLNITESGTLSIIKVVGQIEEVADEETKITANDDGFLVMDVSAADMNADSFILVFNGNKVGDVANTVQNQNKVNIIDVDYILHQTVADNFLIPGTDVYADVNKDAQINVVDAEYVFAYISNSRNDESEILMEQQEE